MVRIISFGVIGSILFSLWPPSAYCLSQAVPSATTLSSQRLFPAQAFSLLGLWHRRVESLEETHFPQSVSEVRGEAAAHRKRLRAIRKSRKQPPKKSESKISKLFSLVAGSIFIGIASTILVIWNDARHPQLLVKSFDVLAGPAGLNQEKMTELVNFRLIEIETVDLATAPNSDFLLFGEQLEFREFATKQAEPWLPEIHAVEHLFGWEPPEASGLVDFTNSKHKTEVRLLITGGGQAAYTLQTTVRTNNKFKVADEISKQILYHQNPYLLALYYYRRQELDESLAVINDYCLGNTAYRAWGNLLWGRILNDQNKPKEALIKLKEAIDHGPKDPTFISAAKSGMSRSENALTNYQNAIDEAKKSIALDSQNARSYVHLGNAYLGLKRNDDALQSFRTAIALSERFAKAYKGKGDAFVALGNKTDAISAYNEALRLNPTEPGVHFALAAVYQNSQRFDEAITTYQAYLAAFPKAPADSVKTANDRISSLKIFRRNRHINPVRLRSFNSLFLLARSS